jgi:hypothetical protein
MIWLYLVIAVLVILVGVLVYLVANLMKKIDIYEEWVRNFSQQVNKVYIDLRTVDDKNLFVKDDDVGFVFSEILRIIEEFNEKIGNEKKR